MDDVLQEELKDERVPLFLEFSEKDHAHICHGLFEIQNHFRGASRISEYQSELGKAELRELYKHTYNLWRTARAAYQKQYGHMPI
jgi:hypothetical protein